MHQHADSYRASAVKARRAYYALVESSYASNRYALARWRWAQKRARAKAGRGGFAAKRRAYRALRQATVDALWQRRMAYQNVNTHRTTSALRQLHGGLS